MLIHIIIASTIGAVVGFLFNHFLDSRYIKELISIYDEYIGHLKEIINRYEVELGMQNAKKSKAKVEDDFFTFNDTSVAPEGWEEIDFGGNF